MANGQSQLAPAPMAANMFGKAPPIGGNPFSAQPSAAPANNPFLAKAAAAPAPVNPFSQPSSVFGTAPAPAPAAAAPNPFQAALAKNNATAQPAASPFTTFGQPSQGHAPAPLPFQKTTAAQPPAASPFLSQAASRTSSPFGGPSAGANGSTAAPAAKNPFQAHTTTKTATPSPFGAASTAPASSLKALDAAKAAAKKSVHFHANPVSSVAPAPAPAPALAHASSPFSTTSNITAAPKANNTFSRLAPPKAPAPPAPNATASQSAYTQKILAQLQKDRIKPPQWPADPGNPDKAAAMEALWSAYDDYRAKARDSLVKAGLIDDPNVRKKLNEAIDFKGICEDMCPEFEKIERIYQHNVMMSEKTERPDGTMWASPALMVKALTRSSAGQEAPLPMDVRTVAALQRTLDYLIDTVLGDESRLPVVHNFLWDRTRAIRRDFIFHSTMTEAEMQGQIYCLEVITRFHVTCLHLLSRPGAAPEGFDQHQERVQLSKALLSLLQAYDDCRDRQIACANEAEFRAYFILLNAQDPNVQHRVSEWGTHLWYASDEVQTAMTLAQAMQSVWDWRGPLRPAMPTTTALGAFATFFRIVESPQVSYTMACFAEAQFMHVRRGILRNMVRAYARTRDSPKDLTLAALNAMLRFDTADEAWDFVTANGLAFSSDDRRTAYLDLSGRPSVSNEPLPQTFSQNLVERKRAGHSLPEALHTTVFETPGAAAAAGAVPAAGSAETSMFVKQSPTPTPTPTFTPAGATNTFSKPPAAPATSNIFGSLGTAKPPSATAPAANALSSVFSSGTSMPASSSSTPTIFPTGPSLFQTTASNNQKATDAASTTPTTSPAKPAPTSNIFGLGGPKPDNPPASKPPAASIFSQPAQQALPASQPPAASSFASLFPTSAPTTTTTPSDIKPTTTSAPAPAPAPVPVPSSLFSGTTASKPADSPATSIFSSGATPPVASGTTTNAPAASSSSVFSQIAAVKSEASPQPLFPPAAAAQPPTAAPTAAPPTLAPTAPPAPSQSQLMDSFSKWLVLGDNGILDEFTEGFVEYLVRATFDQFQHDETVRAQREEDEQSWAAARAFKTYNLRVKFFYAWRRIARERALDRRARQARDEVKAYRAAKRAEQRRAAETAAAEERARALAARRMDSREARLLEELGYTEFSAAARKKRKALAEAEQQQQRQRSVSLSAVEEAPLELEPAPPPQQPQPQDHVFQKPDLPHKMPVRSAIKDGISSTVSRARDFISSRMAPSSSKRRHRASYGDGEGDALDDDDGASISGESVQSMQSVQSMRSMQSMRSNFSRVSRDSIGSNTNTGSVTYYRRSVPGKSRMHSIFTRVPSESSTGVADAAAATAAAAAPPPKKMTNFMRYSRSGGSLSSRRHPATSAASFSPSPSDRPSFSSSVGSNNGFGSSVGSAAGVSGMGAGLGTGGSKVKSSYWRLRAMGMVQMPNKQYLHESLALPMLQDGKRFPGVGNYGLPPVPAGGGGDEAADADKEMVTVHDDNEEEQQRTETYAEEIMRRMVPSAGSRKRVFSGSTEAVNTAGVEGGAGAGQLNGSTTTATAVTSPPDAKKARVETAAGSQGPLSEAERVIREMRELASAMDEDRDWFKEQTELLKKGVSAWDQ